MVFDLIQDKSLQFFIGLFTLLRLQNFLTADIRRHNQCRILEIDGPPLGIGQPAVIKHLQQNIEYVMMGFFDLVQ